MTVKELIPILDTELLEQVKNGINLKGNDFQDDTLYLWIQEVKQDLLYAGVSADVLNSTLAVGCITRGVDDRWSSHLDAYSEMFYTGAERLRSIKIEGAE